MEVCDPCWTCRNRRIQCDQAGPPCAKCEKAGLECFDKRPFRWVKGVAIRGKMQGRSYEGKTEESFSALKPVRSPAKKSRALVSGEKLPIALQDPSTSHLDQVSKYYIDYCEDHIQNPREPSILMYYQITNEYASCSSSTTATKTHSGA